MKTALKKIGPRDHGKARVLIQGRGGVTCPQPDWTAFRDYPRRLPINRVRWEDLVRILVVEIVSPNDPYKDLVRNLELYLQVPSIKEYWVIDPSGPMRTSRS